jgi:hypothetical protein
VSASAFYSGGTLNESGSTGPSSELVLPDGIFCIFCSVFFSLLEFCFDMIF